MPRVSRREDRSTGDRFDRWLLTKPAGAGDIDAGAPGAAGPFAPVPVTAADVERVLARHQLGSVRGIQRLAGGQINAAYRVNGELVLRVRPVGKDGAAFRKECALFERLRGQVPVPEVVALDESGEALPGAYLICRRAPGESLARVWLSAGPRQRAWLLGQLVELLRALHAVDFPACGDLTGGELSPAPSWRDYLEARFRRRLEKLRALPGVPHALLDAAEAFQRRAAPALEVGGARLVHRDLHFGNILAEENRITALLDFEAAVAAPPDYELDQIARFLRWPGVFLTDMPGVQAGAFRAVWSGLRAAYPELFQTPRLTTRLAVYALEYDLAALRDCLTGVWDHSVRQHVIARMEAALEHKVLPPD
jgi:aminoglycoside phosphotransferase (APT) family kinase protein